VENEETSTNKHVPLQYAGCVWQLYYFVFFLSVTNARIVALVTWSAEN